MPARTTAALASAVLMALVFAAGCGRGAEPDRVVCSAKPEHANLDLTLKGLDGEDVRLADFKGKVVFLNFWATWCVPCQVEIPILIDLQRQYKSAGLEVVGVVVLDDFAKAKPYTEKARMNYTVVDGTMRQDIEDAYGPLPGLPTSFVIARDGSVCATHIGLPRPDANERIEDRIRRAFEAEIKALL